MSLFDNQSVHIDILKQRAFNYRWATLPSDVIPLTAADPDFPVAVEIVEAIKEYANPGIFSYGPSEGLPIFKEAISAWYGRTKNVFYKPENILPVNSAAYGLFIAASCLLEKDDEAIIFEPVDFLFRKSIENAGAKVVSLPLNKKDGSIPRDLAENAITSKTKVVYICNPNNPLGLTVTKPDLEWLGALAEKHNLMIIADEIWADINFDNSFIATASVNEINKNRTITISGLSKNFALAGLRIGYVCCANEELFSKILIASKHQSTANGISSISQIAGAAALTTCDYWLNEFLVYLAKAKNYAETRLVNNPYLETQFSNATYLLFPTIKNTTFNSDKVWNEILTQTKLALVPGGKNWFEESSEGHIRICYATSLEILEEAFNRLEKLKL